MINSTENFTQAIRALKSGEPVLLLDNHDRENEGDLVVAAEKITPKIMNFLIQKGSGIVCLVIDQKRQKKLNLPMMLQENTNRFQTPFTVSIESRLGVTTGVSAQDRTTTVLTAMDDSSSPQDLARPGHIFPLCAQPDGVLTRMGHTEGAHDILKIAGLKPGAVICELMNPDGSMTIGTDREKFAHNHNIPIITVEDILFYRLAHEKDLSSSETYDLNTRDFGELTWTKFANKFNLKFDIFTKNTINTNPKIKIFPISNIHQKYLNIILNNSGDDPVSHILHELKNHKFDIGIITYNQAQESAKKSYSEQRIQAAWICQALSKLKISGKIQEPDIIQQIYANFFASPLHESSTKL